MEKRKQTEDHLLITEMHDLLNLVGFGVDVPMSGQDEEVICPGSKRDCFLYVSGFLRQSEDGRRKGLVFLVG